MSKCWNVRLKRSINSNMPAGISIQVITQQNCHDYPTLQKALKDAGYPVNNMGGVWSESFWEWY